MGALAEGANWGHVIAAYAATALILGALVAASLAGARRSRRELAELEKRDPRRRTSR